MAVKPPKIDFSFWINSRDVHIVAQIEYHICAVRIWHQYADIEHVTTVLLLLLFSVYLLLQMRQTEKCWSKYLLAFECSS